jgi:hypothetical protein
MKRRVDWGAVGIALFVLAWTVLLGYAVGRTVMWLWGA